MLAEDVVFRSPVAFTSYEGRPIVAAIPRGVGRDFTDFRHVRELEDSDGHGGVLLFETCADGTSSNVIDLIRTNDAGLISEFTVTVRPLPAAITLAAALGAQLPQIQAEAIAGLRSTTPARE